jgi:hypothetical protein
MNLFRYLFVLLLGGVLLLVLSDDARRAVGKPLDRFREHFYQMRDGQSPRVPMAVSKLANDSGVTLQKASEQFNTALVAAPRFRFEGKVAETLPSGHLLVVGHVRNSASVMAPTGQGYALFGLPGSASLVVNTPVRCDVHTAGVHQFMRQDGRTLRLEEVVYAGEYIWTKEPGRTLLDR